MTISKLFTSDCVVVTAAVGSKIAECAGFRLWVNECLNRHFSGDYGDISEADRDRNNQGLQEKERIMSAYQSGDEKIWIITDAGHGVTTVLFPWEY